MSRQEASVPDRRYNRRLGDKIVAAFDHACDDGDLTTAAELLSILETHVLREVPRPDRREIVVAPLLNLHQRLWALKAAATPAALPGDLAAGQAFSPV